MYLYMTRETTAMRAPAVYWMRFLVLTLLALIAATLFIGSLTPSNTGNDRVHLEPSEAFGRVYAAPTQVKVVDLIPSSLSGETNQDSEPFLAIQTANPQVMVASAFTPNPVSNTGNAPVRLPGRRKYVG